MNRMNPDADRLSEDEDVSERNPVQKLDDKNHENIKAVYDQLCESYRAIDEFRAKLLGLLPLASGAGIFLLIRETGKPIDFSLLFPVGVFGFVVTLGLFVFEIYGIRKCTELINVGKNLEDSLGVKGQFRTRPDGVIGFRRIPKRIAGFINEPFASGIIYPAVLGAWAFVALYSVQIIVAGIVGISVFVVGLNFSLEFNGWLGEANDGSEYSRSVGISNTTEDSLSSLKQSQSLTETSTR
jgi:hypothetical protein